jgi:PAS domain S-box-containing protein
VSEFLTRQLEVASLTGEVVSVMNGIVDHLMELDGADGASLSTIEEDEAFFKVSKGADDVLLGRRMPMSDTLGNECMDGGIRVLRATTGDEVVRSLTAGAGAIVLAPLQWDGAIRGILGVRSTDARAFPPAEVEAIRMLARGAEVALRNAELIERLAESERHYRELHDQAADAALVLARDGAIDDANEAAGAMLWYPPAELRTMHARDLIVDDLAQKPLQIEEVIRLGELRSDRRVRRQDGTVLDVECAARVLDKGRVHIALRDVTQRKRNEERLRTSLGRLHAIVQTQQEISALELDSDAITSAIVERAQRLAGGDGAAVQWFEGHESVYHFASGIAARHIGLRLDRASSLTGVSALLGEAVYAADTETDPRVDAAACRRIGMRSLICAPLYRAGDIRGALTVMAARPNAFDELAVETTRLMAEFVSTAIRNSTELETRRQLVEQLRTQAQVVENMQMPLWILVREPEGVYRLEYANAASERATTVPVEDLLSLTAEEIVPDHVGHRELFDRVIERREPIDLGEVDYDGGGRIPRSIFSMKVFPLPESRVAVTFENITEAVRANRALQESEERFRGAFHAASLGMALTALDGSFVQVNDRFAEMLGYTVDELAQLDVRSITHRDDVEVDLANSGRLRTGEIDSYEREKRYVRKDGSVLWAHLTVSAVRDYEGRPTHVLSHVQDITAQREASLLYEATFERSVVPKIVADSNRRLVDVNPAAAELLGVSREEALVLTLDELLPGEPVADLWSTFVAAGELEAEVTMRRPDGGSRRIEFVATANVRPGRHIAVVRDLSKQKELEMQLRQAQKMEAVGRLAGGIAHDFNNLLTAISGYSEFLIAGQTDARMKRHAEEIRKAAARAAALTGQLLAFSRRQVLQPRVLDLNAVVSDMDMMLRRLIGEDVELVTLLEHELSPVQADPTQVEQVIVNLAVNARDAMPHGGSVTIETVNVSTDDGDFVELRLTDTGIGMTESERQQLFDPFFTTKEGGTGLGLATVYGIVEQSGGTIEVDSAPGMGSSFRILLPSATEGAEEHGPQTPADAPEAGSETILLVEDETVVRQLVAEILETNGYTVLQAADGPSALELLRRHPGQVELLLTDVVMPGMSGPEVAQAVLAMRPGTQVLYTSGYTDSQIGHHGVLEPGIAFLQKPFSSDDLTRKVRAVLDESVIGVD